MPKLETTLALCALFLAGGSPQEPAAPERPTLADVAWIAGSWATAGGPTLTEELWMEPRSGLMLGLNRSSPADGSGQASFEYLRIEERADGVVYVASPGGGRATDFRLVSCSPEEAVFANPEHDFPKRIIYARKGQDGLEARAVGDDDHGPSWAFRHVAAGTAERR